MRTTGMLTMALACATHDTSMVDDERLVLWVPDRAYYVRDDIADMLLSNGKDPRANEAAIRASEQLSLEVSLERGCTAWAQKRERMRTRSV